MLSSITAFLIGMALAIVVGIAIGVAMGRVRIVELILEPYVTALYSTPSIALIPLFILWFGVGLTAKAFIIFFLSIFIIVINTFTGVKNLSQSIVDVGAAFGANERQAFWMIVLPAALPFIMTGLRLAVGRGILAMIVAEFFTSISGLGGMIVKYGNFFQTAKMFVPILLVSLLGVCAAQACREEIGTLEGNGAGGRSTSRDKLQKTGSLPCEFGILYPSCKRPATSSLSMRRLRANKFH